MLSSIHIIGNMKTIAVTIDEPTLERMDRLVSAQAKGNRSELVRVAIQDYVNRLERAVEEEHERGVFQRNRKRLERQAAALVKEQAKP
jgi:metal-responsive CopG/Arc/MetJ family transcriptional regulator